MTMRRPDFKQLAEVIREHKIHGHHYEPYFRVLVDDIALVCKKSNPSFDKSKFMKACGYYDE